MHKNATIKGSISSGTIEAPFATITDTLQGTTIRAMNVDISTMLVSKEARLGSLNDGSGRVSMSVESGTGTVAINSDLVVGGDASFSGALSATNLTASVITGVKNVTTSHLTCTNSIILEHGDIDVMRGTLRASKVEISDGGFLSTNGAVQASTVIASEAITGTNVSATNVIHAPLIMGDTLESKKINVKTLIANSIEVVDGNLTIAHGNTINSESINTQSMYAATAEVRDGIKATSFIAKRIYSEDVTASGYVTAQNVNAKGSVKVLKDLEVEETVTAKGRLIAEDIQIHNSLEATTAKFGGFVEAGKMEVRKLKIIDELTVDNMDVRKRLDVIEDLRIRVDRLEALVSELSSSLILLD